MRDLHSDGIYIQHIETHRLQHPRYLSDWSIQVLIWLANQNIIYYHYNFINLIWIVVSKLKNRSLKDWERRAINRSSILLMKMLLSTIRGLCMLACIYIIFDISWNRSCCRYWDGKDCSHVCNCTSWRSRWNS